MAHFEELYPGRFLKGPTLSEPRTIRIRKLVGEALEGDDGTKKPKAILKYVGKDGEGEMVCCKTNAMLIAQMFGADHTKWEGKLITLHFDPEVRFGNEKPGGIRVLGSPELTKAMTVRLKRPRRKKEDVFLLQPTGKAAQAKAESASTAPPTAPESEAARFCRLMTAAQDVTALDRIIEDARATLKGADLHSAEQYAVDRRAALGA